MAIKVGNASIDENGKITGGEIGDQNAKEICVRSWYSKPWNVYLECTDDTLAKKASDWMDRICEDKDFGYDQNERWTGYYSIKKNGYKLDGAKGEFDCSSLVITCYIFAGLDISPDGYTGNLKSKLLKSGKFIAYTDSSHLLNDTQAKRGGIFLKEGSHVVMALEDGHKYYTPTKTITPESDPEDIKWAQGKLNNVLPEWLPKLKIDGDYGAKTRIAVLIYWDMLGWGKDTEDDGTGIGKKTIGALLDGRIK